MNVSVGEYASGPQVLSIPAEVMLDCIASFAASSETFAALVKEKLK